MANFRVQVKTPEDIFSAAAPYSEFGKILLAQGDSWFSVGAIPPWSTSNLLFKMTLDQRTCAVNCARPGATLAHMIDWRRNPQFVSFLAGPQAERWHGLLLSAGGNDLIDALNAPFVDGNGMPVEPARRLLLKADEWGASPNVSRYLSVPGWQTFKAHLGAQFNALIALRDSGINAGCPVFFHTYAYARPRNAPAAFRGPWLYPALRCFAIPEGDWMALAMLLKDRLAELLQSIVAAHPAKNLHLIDTRKVLKPAPAGSTGPSADWENEIHPTPGGYGKLAARWRAVIEANF